MVKRKTQEEWDKEVKKLVDDEYIFIEPYENTYTSLKVRHSECGHEYKTAPRDFIKGRRCPNCYRKSRRKTQEQWDNQVFELVGDEYIFNEPYVTDYEKIEVTHIDCGNSYRVKPNNFINGYRCPFCKSSKGEKLIEKYLKGNGISFKVEHSFNDLKFINPLKFDFYLPDFSVLVEYQGEQHSKPIEFFGGERGFKKQVLRDNMKRQYAKEKGYTLIEIPHTCKTKEDIAKFLDKEILL